MPARARPQTSAGLRARIPPGLRPAPILRGAAASLSAAHAAHALGETENAPLLVGQFRNCSFPINADKWSSRWTCRLEMATPARLDPHAYTHRRSARRRRHLNGEHDCGVACSRVSACTGFSTVRPRAPWAVCGPDAFHQKENSRRRHLLDAWSAGMPCNSIARSLPSTWFNRGPVGPPHRRPFGTRHILH